MLCLIQQFGNCPKKSAPYILTNRRLCGEKTAYGCKGESRCLDPVGHEALWLRGRAGRRVARYCPRRICLAARAFQLGQDHLAQHPGRLRAADVRGGVGGRAGYYIRATAQARHRNRVPELRAVPAYDGWRERGVSAAGTASAKSRLGPKGIRCTGDGRVERL